MALLHYYYLLLLLIANSIGQAFTSQDLHALLAFKSSVDPFDRILNSWNGHDPCSGSWHGVKCHRERVVGVFIDNASLSGTVAPVFGLEKLQILSLTRNALRGSLPHLNNATNPKLRYLFLSHNQLNGTLNVSLPYLFTLRIENNLFSGDLQGLHLPFVEDFNVSHNNLSGEITDDLSKFSSFAFSGNQALCGSPLQNCVEVSRLSNDTANSPSSAESISNMDYNTRTLTNTGLAALLAIGVGDILVISVSLAVLIGMYIWLRKKLMTPLNNPSTAAIYDFDQEQGHRQEKEKKRGLICFRGGEDLRLESLLKASAEVLGKGLSGSTYKAVLDDGIIVAVKRLSAVQFPTNNKAFDRQMQLTGRISHQNVVSLRAYCNAHEEKLLVYDYMPNGNLHSLLQRNGGDSERRLNWISRKQILLGVAEGLNFIHSYPARPPLVHANIKPSNILIDEHNNACIAEWGIMRFATNCHQSLLPCSSSVIGDRGSFAAPTIGRGYTAPELLNCGEKATQESDVYSYGMVLLELVTDNEVDESECEGEMMGIVKIGMMCTCDNIQDRPKMSQVLRMLREFI